MPLTGYTSATPSDVLFDSAVVLIDDVPFAVSRGGVRVTVEEEWHEVEFDGRAAPVEGLDRITAVVVTVSGTFLELGPTQIQQILHNVTGVLAGAVTTWTPRTAREFLAVGNYVEDLVFRVQRGDEQVVEFDMPRTRVEWSFASEDKNEAGISVTFVSRLDSTVAVAA